MTLKSAAFALAFAAVAIAFSPVRAETAPAEPPVEALPTPDKAMTLADLEQLREEIRSYRKQVLAATLTLTPDEAARFWPVYDQYAAERTTIKDDYYALLVEYVNKFGKYDDAGATDFITRWLAIDTRLAELRTKYVPLVGAVLPGVKAATFFQIDRRMSELIDLKLASKLPILQTQTQVQK